MIGKKKMSKNTFMLIVIPLIIFLLVLIIAVTVALNQWAAAMDMRFGRGAMHTVRLEGTENWDANYYGERLTAEETKRQAIAAAKGISDEGIVLLKNNGALPLTLDAKVTPFGRDIVDPIYGGGGSGQVSVSQDYVVTCEEMLTDTFGANLNTDFMRRISYILAADGGKGEKYERGVIWRGGATYNIGEFPSFEFAEVEYTLDTYNDAGIVMLGRPGGEGSDLSKDMSGFGGTAEQHQLELSIEERDIIEYAKEKCEKVIVVLNMSTTMEIGALEEDDGIDAILWIGSPGAIGFASLGDILVGEINPSGRTADTFAADFTKDPTWKNLGNFELTNVSAQNIASFGNGNAKYLEYEEGIYLGYRYYESAAKEYGESWYSAWKNTADKASGTGVVYPFGYGRSYTVFSQKILNYSTSGAAIKMSIEVENTGTEHAGKEVVQIYYTAPYTKGGIEKSYVNLVAFDKTDLLAPGEKQIIDIQFLKEDMASYDQNVEKAYVLDGGEYTVKLMKNSHEMWANQSFSFNINKTIFGETNPRQSEIDAQSYLNADGSLEAIPATGLSDSAAKYIAATNRFDYMTGYMQSPSVENLSRSDLSRTFPEQAVDKDAPDNVLAILSSGAFDYETDAELGNVPTSKVYMAEKPIAGMENGLKLIDLRGFNYYDERWDILLQQLKYSNEELLVTVGANDQTNTVESIGKPATKEEDGPQGILGNYVVNEELESACAWCSEPVLAATFNIKLAYEMGKAIGQEALAMGINGWYAPGLNMHRTPFSGRNFEYYSEDPLLSGKIAARVVSGAGDRGVYTFIKHFALNDQETNRMQLCVWADEQTMREIYLRAFEICIKEAKCRIKYISDDAGTVSTITMRASTAIMTAQTRIGFTHSTDSYALLTEVARGEWGFNGMVNTDMRGGTNHDRRLRAGNDLSMDGRSVLSTKDQTSATAMHAYRKALKNIFYTVVNSNIMIDIVPGTIFYYDMSPWAIWLIVGNIIIYSIIVALAVILVLKLFRNSNENASTFVSGRKVQ